MKLSSTLILLISLMTLSMGCQSTRQWASKWSPKKLVSKLDRSDQPVPVIPNKEATLANHQPTSESIQQAADEFAKGESHLNLGNHSQARKHLEEVVRLQPNHAAAHHRLAYIYDQKKDYDNAKIHYLMAMRLDPRNPDIPCDLGYSYLLQEDFEQSEHFLTQALKINPQHSAAIMNLAAVKSELNDYDGAYALLSQVGNEQQVQMQMAQLFPDGRPPKTALVSHSKKNDQDQGILSKLPFQKSKKDPNQELRDMIEQARLQQRANVINQSPHQTPAALQRQHQEVTADQINQMFAEIDAEGRPDHSKTIELNTGPMDHAAAGNQTPQQIQQPLNILSGTQPSPYHQQPTTPPSTLPFGVQSPRSKDMSSIPFDPMNPLGAISNQQPNTNSNSNVQIPATDGSQLAQPQPSMIPHAVTPAGIPGQPSLSSMNDAMGQAAALGMNMGPGELFPTLDQPMNSSMRNSHAEVPVHNMNYSTNTELPQQIPSHQGMNVQPPSYQGRPSPVPVNQYQPAQQQLPVQVPQSLPTWPRKANQNGSTEPLSMNAPQGHPFQNHGTQAQQYQQPRPWNHRQPPTQVTNQDLKDATQTQQKLPSEPPTPPSLPVITPGY